MGKLKMSPSVRRALAYAYATGCLPKHIHIGTWSAACGLLEGEPLRRKPSSAALDEVRGDPLAMAHDYLSAQGFRADSYCRGARTSHYIAYTHPDDGREALAHRGGSVTIITVRDHAPYRTSEGVSLDRVRAAL